MGLREKPFYGPFDFKLVSSGGDVQCLTTSASEPEKKTVGHLRGL